jgi:hypothetical protein
MWRRAGRGTVGGMPESRRRLTRRLHTLLTIATVALTPAAGLVLAAPPATSAAVVSVEAAPVSERYARAATAMRTAGGAFADQPGQFLLFDASGRGRVAQVFGDLETADRIAILVPGAGNRVTNFWRGVGGERERSPAVQAADLYEAGGGHVAVIAWLGYDAPLVVTEAAREDLARSGAVALDRFVAGLLTVRPRATIALFGHSYGSTVIGLAAPDLPAAVTDIAVVGSPGMGVHAVAELRTSARVWAGEAAADWVRWVPEGYLLGLGHGVRPVAPSFGAQVISTADVDDHDHYFRPGTDSLEALARIAVGTGAPSPPPPSLDLMGGDGGCCSGWSLGGVGLSAASAGADEVSRRGDAATRELLWTAGGVGAFVAPAPGGADDGRGVRS